MIISLDLSTKSTGYASFEGEKLIGHANFISNDSDVVKRIIVIAEEILGAVKRASEKYEIETIIIEEVRPDLAKITQVNRVLMWLQGYVVIELKKEFPDVDIQYIYPSQWRKELGIRTGRGVKRDVLKQKSVEFVKEKYKLEVNDDEAEAICIGHAYMIMNRNT